MAALVKYGMQGPFPLNGFPEGKARIRMRSNSFPVVFIFQPGKSIRKFLVAVKDGCWVPYQEVQANYRLNQTSQPGTEGGE